MMKWPAEDLVATGGVGRLSCFLSADPTDNARDEWQVTAFGIPFHSKCVTLYADGRYERLGLCTLLPTLSSVPAREVDRCSLRYDNIWKVLKRDHSHGVSIISIVGLWAR